jgi:hypothetical protein
LDVCIGYHDAPKRKIGELKSAGSATAPPSADSSGAETEIWRLLHGSSLSALPFAVSATPQNRRLEHADTALFHLVLSLCGLFLTRIDQKRLIEPPAALQLINSTVICRIGPRVAVDCDTLPVWTLFLAMGRSLGLLPLRDSAKPHLHNSAPCQASPPQSCSASFSRTRISSSCSISRVVSVVSNSIFRPFAPAVRTESLGTIIILTPPSADSSTLRQAPETKMPFAELLR